MKTSSSTSNNWCSASELNLAIPSEKTYQQYLVSLHYRALEYQHFSARFSASKTARVLWHATDIPSA